MPSSGVAATAGLAGIGLRAPHVAEILGERPRIGWLEVHTENYLGGGPAARALAAIRAHYPVSLHGVGLSLGSAEGLDRRHLARVADLARRIEPVLVSEHLSWSIAGGVYFNHLLPLPYTEESLALVCANVSQAQEALGRPLLVENPSSYLRFRHSPIPEPEFLAELARAPAAACSATSTTSSSRAPTSARMPTRIWPRCPRLRSARSTWPATRGTTRTAGPS